MKEKCLSEAKLQLSFKDVCELTLCSQVIFKSMKVADDRFCWSSKCEASHSHWLLALSICKRVY